MRALARGETTVAVASIGNAAAATAGVCAAAGLSCVVFVPHDAPAAKLAHLVAIGATVLPVNGTYDQAVDLCFKACERFGCYCRNTAFNSFTHEGKKTVALEICEQSAWRPPDALLVAVEDGNVLHEIARGFDDALALGWIERVPRLIGVQAEGANALASAWRTGATRVTAMPAATIADSINVGLPRDGEAASKVVRNGGGFVTVSDEEIAAAIGMVGRSTGLFVEPASAAAFAGIPSALRGRRLDASERVVIVNSGSGLEDVRPLLERTKIYRRCRRNLRRLKRD